MKYLKYLAAIAILLGVSIVSYNIGRYQNIKDYEAACILSDICRNALDYDILDKPGFEDLYYGVLDNLDCYDSHITKEELHHNYSWCY